MTSHPKTLREQVFDMMRTAFGEPEVAPVESGNLYRWTLRRQFDLNIYITMDSPEHSDLAHILVSDSTQYQSAPVVSTVVYSVEEAHALIKRILEQWRRPRADPDERRNPEIEDIGGSGHGGRPPGPPEWTRGLSDRESRSD